MAGSDEMSRPDRSTAPGDREVSSLSATRVSAGGRRPTPRWGLRVPIAASGTLALD